MFTVTRTFMLTLAPTSLPLRNRTIVSLSRDSDIRSDPTRTNRDTSLIRFDLRRLFQVYIDSRMPRAINLLIHEFIIISLSYHCTFLLYS